MANYTDLKAAIQQVIRENGNEEITGDLLQQVLLAMVNSLGAGYLYMGIATPALNPGTPDQRVFYLAMTAGTYTDFDGIAIMEGEMALFRWDSEWHKETVGAQSDWKENNPLSKAYVRNRTHWVEEGKITLKWTGETILDAGFYAMYNGVRYDGSYAFYGWFINIEGYDFVARMDPYDNTILLVEDFETEPTVMRIENFFLPDGTIVYEGDEVRFGETVHKLDKKFLDLTDIIPGHGTFAERPAPNKIYIGYTYFRTDGEGGTRYPIFYGGDERWYKADGTEVTS